MYDLIVEESEFLRETHFNKVLDIATGQGEFLEMLTKNVNYDVAFGCDISENNLKKARERLAGKRSTVFIADGVELPFLDNEFDLITISNSLHHFQEVDKVIKDATRILKKGGILLINEMVSDDLSKAQEIDMKMVHLFVSIDKILGYTHNYSFTCSEVKSFKSLSMDIYELVEEKIYVEHKYDIGVEEDSKIQYMVNAIDKKIEKIKDRPEYKELHEEGELIKLMMVENGLSMQNQVCLLYRKR